MTLYSQFRSGLLKHIKMEENVVIPAVVKEQEGKPLTIAQKLRTDHGAIVALLVPPPSPTIIRALRYILAGHHRIEEGQGGLYDLSERILSEQLDQLMVEVLKVSEVPVLPHKSSPEIMEAVGRALERAGYKLSDFVTDEN